MLHLTALALAGTCGFANQDAAVGKETIRIWDHSGSVVALAFSPRGDRLVSGGLSAGVESPTALAFDLSNKVLAVGGAEGTIR